MTSQLREFGGDTRVENDIFDAYRRKPKIICAYALIRHEARRHIKTVNIEGKDATEYTFAIELSVNELAQRTRIKRSTLQEYLTRLHVDGFITKPLRPHVDNSNRSFEFRKMIKFHNRKWLIRPLSGVKPAELRLPCESSKYLGTTKQKTKDSAILQPLSGKTPAVFLLAYTRVSPNSYIRRRLDVLKSHPDFRWVYRGHCDMLKNAIQDLRCLNKISHAWACVDLHGHRDFQGAPDQSLFFVLQNFEKIHREAVEWSITTDEENSLADKGVEEIKKLLPKIGRRMPEGSA